MVENGCSVLLSCRDSYVNQLHALWKGVALTYCLAPRRKCLEATVHTLISLIRALTYRPDIVHIHAIGPSLLIPVARLMGFKVVMTHHGPDYERQKWGPAARFILKMGEKLGGCYADQVIVISNLIADRIRQRCRRDTNLVYNGVTPPQRSGRADFLKSLDVSAGEYILAVARFVPEKGLHDLIRAFQQLECPYKLVIAGNADHETEYSRRLKSMAAEDSRIVLTGYIVGEELNQIYSHARLFVLPSYHEGLPIVLLEALSYGLPVLVSDIAANLEVQLPTNRHFRCGDVYDLRNKLQILLQETWSEEERQTISRQIEEKYNWDLIAGQTIAVYRKALGLGGEDRRLESGGRKQELPGENESTQTGGC